MEELKVHIWHVMLREFKNNKGITETAKKICNIEVLKNYHLTSTSPNLQSATT